MFGDGELPLTIARHRSNGVSTLTADYATIGDRESASQRRRHPAQSTLDRIGIAWLRTTPDIKRSLVSGLLENPTGENLVTDVDTVLADVDPVWACDEDTDVPLSLLAKPARLLWILRALLLPPQVHVDSPSPNINLDVLISARNTTPARLITEPET